VEDVYFILHGAFTPRQTRDATKMKYGDGSAGMSRTVNYLGLVALLLGAPAAYVTRGIGAIGFPARSGAPPEISLLRLRKA
jgi:hypothetical protein